MRCTVPSSCVGLSFGASALAGPFSLLRRTVLVSAGRPIITCALNSSQSSAGSTRRPAVEPVGKEFLDQALPANDARGGVRDLFVAEVGGRHLAGETVVLVVQVLEQLQTQARAFAEEHPARAAFPVEAESAPASGPRGRNCAIRRRPDDNQMSLLGQSIDPYI